MLAQPRLVTNESVGDLAERAGTSTATIVRLCRRVGFEGFYHFKIALAEEVGLTRQFGHPDLPSGDPGSVLHQAMGADARDIADAGALIDVRAFDAAVDVIAKASEVFFSGVGTSGPIAQLGALRFMVLGLRTTALQDVQAQDLAARLLRPGAACIAISHTGSSKETVNIARSAQAAGATTVGITSFARSPLTKHCDVVLATGNRAEPRTLELFTTRVVHLSLLGALHASVAARRPEPSGVIDAVNEVTGRHLQ